MGYSKQFNYQIKTVQLNEGEFETFYTRLTLTGPDQETVDTAVERLLSVESPTETK